MKATTVRLPADTVDDLDAEADEQGLSRAEYLREIIRNREEYAEVRDEYESELDRLRDELDAVQAENERLRREKRQVLDVREENDELVRFAEAERDQRDRERDRRSAPVWRRAKYWIFGDPNAQIDDA